MVDLWRSQLLTQGIIHRRLMSYDWRLAFRNLERRDRYYSELKRVIEDLVTFNDKPVVVVAHSMGGPVFMYFMNWIQSTRVLGKVAGTQWIARHIEYFVPIAVPFLGTMKAVPTLISGEMRDTAELNPAIALLKVRWSL